MSFHMPISIKWKYNMLKSFCNIQLQITSRNCVGHAIIKGTMSA